MLECILFTNNAIITIPFCVADVDKQLMTVANIASCPEYERYVVVLMDEMHIKSDLVYDKHSGTNLHYSITIPMHVCTGISSLYRLKSRLMVEPYLFYKL